MIRREAEALLILADQLGPSFAQAAEVIMAATGRVIVSGMGKSGHVARKIAATLASTGTPAHFVHPGEASHGDLGMLTKGDVALVLSNSGETVELADIIAHTRRFGIPLIAVAARADSTLVRQSDVAILLPDAPEACETGIVPTTSTTMMLALGDALAIALMEHRAFTPEHFRLFHPGGKLGAKLLKVRDLMHVDLAADRGGQPDDRGVAGDQPEGLWRGGCDRGGRAGGDHHRWRLAAAYGRAAVSLTRGRGDDPQPAHGGP